MYNYSTTTICLVLLLLMLTGFEAGHRMGRGRQSRIDDGARVQTNAVQAAILGLFALLLGFTFNMSVQRYDGRTKAVTTEANAIGTARLRAELLPQPSRDEAAAILQRYVDVRVAAGDVNLADEQSWERLRREAAELQSDLWSVGRQAASRDPNPVTTGLFVQAVNELIDTNAERNAALRNHVPELVLLLLMTVFVTGGGVVGYASGVGGGRRPMFAIATMTVLIALVVFIVIDLDRPRRGLIQTDQTSLLELQES